jgi:uncharacterized tellurite resistance protein B-like protein
LKALQFFSESNLFRAVAEKKELTADEQLNKKIEELLDVLLRTGDSELDEQRKRFLAAGGLVVAGADQELSVDEADRILGPLASVTSFPKKFLEEVMKSGNVGEMFAGAAAAVFAANPSERYPMFAYLIDVALSDRAIREQEVELLFNIGEKLFGFSRKEIAQHLGGAIQKSFIPRFFA